jgi:hypothetical protein
MKYLCLSLLGGHRTIRVRDKAHRFAKTWEEETLKKKKDILICGANASGKTRWLDKMHSRAIELWPKNEAWYIRSQEPLARYLDDPRLAAYAATLGKDYQKLRPHQRHDLMREYFGSHKVTLLLDDAHKLHGRKLDAVTELLRLSKVCVIGTASEQAMNVSLRMTIDRRQPQLVQLKSEAAYDATSITMWLFILISLGIGAWELSAVLGGLKFLGGGRGANKQV